MTEQEWRDSLNVGDEVAVKKDGVFSIHKIERATQRKVFTKYHHFIRRTGWGRDRDGQVEIAPVTPELTRATEDAHERKRLRGVISLALPAASVDTLRAMIKAMSVQPEEPAEPTDPSESKRRFRPGGFVPRSREENEPE